MLEVPYLPVPTHGPDYSGRYIAAGVLLLLIACLCGCFVGLIPISIAMQARMVAQLPTASRQQMPPMQLAQMFSTLAMYALMTIGAAWLGIGALQKRRWVRPLLLIFSTHGLIVGIISCIVFVAMMALVIQQLPATNAGPQMATVIGMAIGGLFVLALFVGVPATFLLLMKGDAVRATAERHDLKSRWTDGLPVKVLGLVVTLAALAVFELLLLLNPTIPLLTSFLTGWPAAIAIAAHAVLLAWATVLVYRRDIRGWWLGFALIALPLISSLVTTVLMPIDRYLAAAQIPPDAAGVFLENENIFRAVWGASVALFLLAFAVYMVRLRGSVLANAGTTTSTQ